MLRIENISVANGRLTINAIHTEEIFSGRDAEINTEVGDCRQLEIDFGNGDEIKPFAIPKELSENFNPPVTALLDVAPDQWTRFPDNITETWVSTLEVVKNDGKTVFSKYSNTIAAANHFHMYRVTPIAGE